jgi:hypothetical protein
LFSIFWIHQRPAKFYRPCLILTIFTTLFDSLLRFCAMLGLSHNLNVRSFFKDSTDAPAHHKVVIGYQYADGLFWFARCTSSRLRG